MMKQIHKSRMLGIELQICTSLSKTVQWDCFGWICICVASPKIEIKGFVMITCDFGVWIESQSWKWSKVIGSTHLPSLWRPSFSFDFKYCNFLNAIMFISGCCLWSYKTRLFWNFMKFCIMFVKFKKSLYDKCKQCSLKAIVVIHVFRVNTIISCIVISCGLSAPTDSKILLCSRLPPLPANGTAESCDWNIGLRWIYYGCALMCFSTLPIVPHPKPDMERNMVQFAHLALPVIFHGFPNIANLPQNIWHYLSS